MVRECEYETVYFIKLQTYIVVSMFNGPVNIIQMVWWKNVIYRSVQTAVGQYYLRAG